MQTITCKRCGLKASYIGENTNVDLVEWENLCRNATSDAMPMSCKDFEDSVDAQLLEVREFPSAIRLICDLE